MTCESIKEAIGFPRFDRLPTCLVHENDAVEFLMIVGQVCPLFSLRQAGVTPVESDRLIVTVVVMGA
jgi:hypothetical protein